MKCKKLAVLLFMIVLGMSVSAQEMIESDSTKGTEDQENVLLDQMAKMDEMMDLWYVKREIANTNSVLAKVEDDTSAVEHNDSLMSQRLSKIITAVPLAFNSKVKAYCELYAVKRKRSSSVILGLAQYYYPWMQEIFDKYNVPEELIYITIIESALNPLAVSKAGATGIWQFMYGTGKVYGLEVNTFVDDRRDPYKATDAAARHLRDLYTMFNDWGLAISAYNCGAGNVRKAIQRSGGKTDFWSVCRYLPKETQNYFPAFIGALYMMKYHNEYGIYAPDIAIPSAVDTIMVDKELHLEQLASVLNTDIEEIKILNPQYKRLVVPAYTQPYPIRLRMPDVIKYLDMKDSVYAYQYDRYFTPMKVYAGQFTGNPVASCESKKVYHYVKNGETISKIAAKYGLSIYELKKMNKLSSNYIKVKQRLLVGYEYITPKETAPIQPMVNNTDSTNIVTAVPMEEEPPKDVVYYVKKGDTMSAIADRYHITARKIADYNKIGNINALSIGQKLIIPR